MFDQAQGLRALAHQTRSDQAGVGEALKDAAACNASEDAIQAVVGQPPVGMARVIAVTSGKGGVGKTNFSSNMALALAESGKRVIAVDADLGLANLHVILGINPQYSLEHVMRGERTLQEALTIAAPGLYVIGGASGMAELADLDSIRRENFIKSLHTLDNLADTVLIDTGAGLSRNVLSFLCAVEEVIIVTTPEPTALTDAYATIKVVSRENRNATLMLVVNMANTPEEARAVSERLSAITKRFLGIELIPIGSIPQDPAVSRSVRAGRPFLQYQPASPASQSIRKIAGTLYRTPHQSSGSESGGMGGLLQRMQRLLSFRAQAGTR